MRRSISCCLRLGMIDGPRTVGRTSTLTAVYRRLFAGLILLPANPALLHSISDPSLHRLQFALSCLYFQQHNLVAFVSARAAKDETINGRTDKPNFGRIERE